MDVMDNISQYKTTMDFSFPYVFIFYTYYKGHNFVYQ